MRWTRFQRLALTAFIAVEILIFMGAVVRATGSGLGCPDWPFCYGCWIPPSRAEDIDFKKLDIEKFRTKAARMGRDPSLITPESLRAEFDPVSTWVEYINRLSSVPVGLCVLALAAASVFQINQRRISVGLAAFAALLLVLVNAWLGRQVVISGLKPGIITLHMALAMLLQCILIYAAWRGTAAPWTRILLPEAAARGKQIVLLLFVLVVVEGVMGSQVRELTDHLSLAHGHRPRSEWTAELEQSTVYLIHRSFSWLIFFCGAALLATMRRHRERLHWLDKAIAGLILLQMLLGLVLSQVGVVRVAQILHIGASSLLLSALFLWLLAVRNGGHSGAKPVIS